MATKQYATTFGECPEEVGELLQMCLGGGVALDFQMCLGGGVALALWWSLVEVLLWHSGGVSGSRADTWGAPDPAVGL